MQNGKGDNYRKVDQDKWDDGWDSIVWNKDKKQDKKDKDKEQKDDEER